MNRFISKILVALLGLGLLSACGFTPVYGVGGSGVGPVQIAPIEGRIGYFLGQNLQRRAGLESSNSEPRLLKISVKQRYYNVGLRSDGYATRTRVTFDAQYELGASEKMPEIKGLITSIVSFDSVEKAYSDVSLQSDAEERAANELSEKIWADIINKSRAAKQ